ncbi:MAG: hypothetical protein E6J20_11745 [Chloroflexi bacterium]|nr:MAG: hypothetical protein E6J20_11745 [Chloroflexota bacterium]
MLGFLGVIPAPTPGGHSMTPADLASMAVAGATLILATATVLLAIYTGRSLQQGREELNVAQAALQAAERQAATSAQQVEATLDQVKVSQDQAKTARDALERATETQTIAVIMPIYDRWRSDFSKIRNRLNRGELDLETIDDTQEGYELRAYFGYLELICILVRSGQVQFDVADKVWPTAFRDAYQAAKTYIDRRRKTKPFFARYLQEFVEKQEQAGQVR